MGSLIKIMALTEKAKPIIESQYKSIKNNWLLKQAFKSRGLTIEFNDNILIFNSRLNDKINETNLVQVETFFFSMGLTKGTDYKIEVSK